MDMRLAKLLILVFFPSIVCAQDGILCHFPGRTYDTLPSARWVATGDLDNDSDVDLVIGASGFVQVFLNDAKGNFGLPIDFTVGIGAGSLIIADFDADGDEDILTGNSADRDVSVLLNNGDSSFGPLIRSETLGAYSSARAADFDGDGDLDLALAARNSQTAEDFVVITFNDGDANFNSPELISFGTGNNLSRLDVGDMDQDLDIDVVVTNRDHNHFVILTNDGQGSFKTSPEFPSLANSLDVSTGDLDGDGDLDLSFIRASSESGNDAALVFNLGEGKYSEPAPLEVGSQATQVCIDDVDGDGDNDVITACVGIFSENIFVRLNEGNGQFVSELAVGGIGENPIAFAVDDLNGDGLQDLAILDNSSDKITIQLNDKFGVFNHQNIHEVGDRPSRVAVGDLNGDSFKDIVAGRLSDDDVAVLINDGANNFAIRNLDTIRRSREVALSDLDGDFDLDIVASGDITVIRGNGDGSFEFFPMAYIPNSDPDDLAIGDLDNDGDNDIVTVIDEFDEMVILRNDGNGNFLEVDTYSTVFQPRDCLLADLDGDSDLDVVVGTIFDSNITVFLNDGNGLFGPNIAYPAFAGTRDIVAGDLDGDGDTDLTIAHDSSFSVLFNNGDATFLDFVAYDCPSFTEYALLGDIDNDSDLDLLFAHDSIHTLSVFQNPGNGSFGEYDLYAGGFDPRSLALTDMNNDQVPDLVVANAGSGGVFEIFGNDSVVSVLFGNCIVLGDVNRDAEIDLLDIEPFVNLVVGQEFQLEADTNRDGIVNLLDVSRFVDLLTSF